MRSFPGQMRRCVVQAQIERARASWQSSSAPPPLRDVVNSSLGEHFCHVADALDRNLALIKIKVACHVLVREKVDRAAHDSKELFEATLNWSEVWQITQMPFADQRGLITALLEQGRNGGMLRRQPESFNFVTQVCSFGERFFKTYARAAWITPGDERATRRCAYRRCGIGVQETDALRGEVIEVWRLVIGTAVAT